MIQERHRLRQGKFRLFERILIRRNRVVFRVREIGFGQVCPTKAAVREIRAATDRLRQIRFFEVHIMRHTFDKAQIAQIQADKGGMIHDAARELQRAEQAFFRPGGLRPIHSDDG